MASASGIWRKLGRGLGCLGYLALLAAIFTLVAYFAFSLFVRGGVTKAPELLGLAEDEAVAMLADQGLVATWSTEERFDERVPKGHVMQQSPKAGVYVKRNTEVEIMLSKGQLRLTVPDVRGQALQAAQVSLHSGNLTLGPTYEIFSDQQVGGVVVGQWPAPGSQVAQDAEVRLFLSINNLSEVYLMPDLIGRRYEPVRDFFRRRDMRIGRVSYRQYEGVEEGTVLAQFPLPGHQLHANDVIALTLAAPASRPSAAGSTLGARP